MEKITIKPTYSYSIVSLLNSSSFSARQVSFKFTPFRKQRTPAVCSCSKSPLSSQDPSSKPQTPFWVLCRILQNVKHRTLSQTPKWVSTIHLDTPSEKLLDQLNSNYLQSSGIGLALLSVTSNAKVKISPFVATLAANPTFVSGLLAWVAAQSMKVVLNFFLERKWDLRILFASGGMPSSHSALCTALTTSVALCNGVADSLFPVCLGFSSIVMYDAIGVRRHAGMQAEVLNMIVEDLFQGHPISQRKLKELLGHTPSQVLAGALLGIMVAYICCQGCLVAT